MTKPGGGLDTDDGRRGRALVLTPEAPYPATGGGALRTASLLEYLAARYRLDVIVFREPGVATPRFPTGMAERVEVLDLPEHARHMAARVFRNSSRLVRGVPPLVDRFAGFSERIATLVGDRRYDLAVIEHFWCAPYCEQLIPVSRRTVLDLHNIESVLHQRCAQAEPWPQALAHRVFQQACARLERQWLARFSDLLVTSEADADAVGGLCPQARVTVYPNSLAARPRPEVEERDAIVFSGNLEYHPNISAVRFFRREIWPRLRVRWPGLVWRLVGKNPQAVRRYTQGDPRIEISGPVDDAIRELAAAKVAVAPLLAASGTRLKILEAFAAGRPVVSTTLGAEGLPLRAEEHILLADRPEAFATAVSTLLDSPDLRRRMGAAARELFEKEFTWPAAWARLDL